MARLNWEFELEGKPHSVQFEHTYFAGKRTLIVDGITVQAAPGKLLYLIGGDNGSVHAFKIGQHNCSIQVRGNVMIYSYNLSVDGVDIKASSTLQPPIPEP